MGVNLNLDNWCISNGYTFPKNNIGKLGSIVAVYTDYDVWLKISIRQKIAGIQVDHKTKNYYLGQLKRFVVGNVIEAYTTKTTTVRRGSTSVFYDDTLEEKLGGPKQLMGV